MSSQPPRAAGVLPAALCALGLTAVAALKRAPLSADYAVPRRPGWPAFQAVMTAGQWGGGRAAALCAMVLVLAACLLLALLLWRALDWRHRGDRLKSAPVLCGLLAGAGALLLAARAAVAQWFDLILNVWFAPGAVDLREPLMSFLGVFWVVFFLAGALAALGAWAARGQPGALARCAGGAAAFAVPALLLQLWGGSRCDLRAGSLADAAGIPGEPAARETVLVLTAARDKPDFEAFAVEQGFAGLADLSEESLRRLEGHLARRPLSVFRQQAERLLWEGYARSQDVGRLRERLWASERGGDALAWLVLADHIACAPPDALAADLLDRIADERRWRIGGRGAQMLAAAYAHLGQAAKAVSWHRRACADLGLAEGLAPAPAAGGALRPGAVAGSVRGLRGARVALYAHPSALEPYTLSPNRLVAASRLDRQGRFRFSGLSAGDYYLALAVPAAGLPARKEALAVRGHRGDISLSARRPSAEVSLDVKGGANP